VATRRLGAWPRDVSEAKAWWYLAVSTRRAWKSRSGYACRVLRRRTFGRGFDSRRLHHFTELKPINWHLSASHPFRPSFMRAARPTCSSRCGVISRCRKGRT